MEEQIDLVVVTEEKKKTGGLSAAGVVSLLLHAAMLVWFLTRPATMAPAAANTPMVRYIELLRQNPQTQEFVEAPGPEASTAPLRAPLSDKNRRASMPEPPGDQPTLRPGDGRGLYTPDMGSTPQPRMAQQQAQPAFPQSGSAPQTVSSGDAVHTDAVSDETFVYREPAKAAAAAGAAIDWRSAIRSVRGAVGSAEGPDIGGATGGEIGKAEQGPLSFETSWYDWGPYAQSMVSRIRVNWYANMPQLIRTGIGGVVTIRFTIQRDGRITDVSILESSGHPPYDFAARKAIELSSPLNPLPNDFPNAFERVTAKFYYNMEIP